eukprot:103839-Chlamydomonas_euryale.AAC.2
MGARLIESGGRMRVEIAFGERVRVAVALGGRVRVGLRWVGGSRTAATPQFSLSCVEYFVEHYAEYYIEDGELPFVIQKDKPARIGLVPFARPLNPTLNPTPMSLPPVQGELPFVFQKDKPARIGLIPRSAPSATGKGAKPAVQWFEMPAFFTFHIANAWEVRKNIVGWERGGWKGAMGGYGARRRCSSFSMFQWVGGVHWWWVVVGAAGGLGDKVVRAQMCGQQMDVLLRGIFVPYCKCVANRWRQGGEGSNVWPTDGRACLGAFSPRAAYVGLVVRV